MESDFKKYIKNGYIVFSVNITQKYNEKKKIWKKSPMMKAGWMNFTLNNTYYNKNYNGIAMLTGKVNNLFVIDIDNVNHWEQFLKNHNQKEPVTVTAISGSGGKHLFFNYTDDLDNITSSDHKFGADFDIDVKTNGGCIYISPTSYYNKNLEKQVQYVWKYNILDYDLIDVPRWIKDILLNPTKDNSKEKTKVLSKNMADCNDNIEDDEKIDYTKADIETFLNMLSIDRCDSYNKWIEVGMCLRNINKNYMVLWQNWSEKSSNYDENQDFEKIWNGFGKDVNKKLKLGSLLYWCKEDNPLQYDEFLKTKRVKDLIIAKFPDKRLILGNTLKVSKYCNYTDLNNKECFIYGDTHGNPSMYIETIRDLITIKCKHPECFGKVYPCEHVQLTKQEMNVVFNGDINININSNNNSELIEFKKINLFDDEKLDNIVYNGLNGKPTPYAEIMYYFYKEKYMCAEDKCWYIYQNHKWVKLDYDNSKLRCCIFTQLNEVYTKVYQYYCTLEGKKSKQAKEIKTIINNFDETILKDKIMKELMYIFLEKNNENRDFLRKLNTNDYLIGFENGVYDLQTFTFRAGKPTDFISMTTKYNFKEEYSENYPKLLQFLNDIQPNKDELDYLLTYISTGLFGNTLELFTVLTGSGRNGKSKIIELTEKTFGDYFGSIKSQLLTSQVKDGDSPAPGILDLITKKIVVASETLEGCKLNTGFIKFITGRDTATFRLCHQNDMIKFKAKFITFLACNNIPECDNMDNAFSKRLRCINFPTEFVDGEPIKENQKRKDETINQYFDDWKQDFMLLLINYYKKYMTTRKLIPTENILKWTNQYTENTDIYLQFINECTENSDTHITTAELYEKFKYWFKVNNPNTKLPNNRDFIANIKKYKEVTYVRISKDKTAYGIKKLRLIGENQE
jgi:P4 family phage/plasmid primase-like protien